MFKTHCLMVLIKRSGITSGLKIVKVTEQDLIPYTLDLTTEVI